MKYMKLTKRLFVTFMSTCIIFSSVFFSYSNTLMVKAVEEIDLYEDAVTLVLGVIGVFALPEVTVPAVATYLGWRIQDAGFDTARYLQENVTDNGDGTTTISEDFVQLVLQSYNQYKEENAEKFDGTMIPGADGYYHFDSVTAVKHYAPFSEYNFSITYTDIRTIYPCALLVYSNRPYGEDGRSYFWTIKTVFYIESDDKFFSAYIVSADDLDSEDIIHFTDFGSASDTYGFLSKSPYVKRYTNTGRAETGEGYMNINVNMSGGEDSQKYVEAYSSSIPVYHDLGSLKEGLRTGDFSAAYNYGKVSGLESSKYTGSYSGGDITVTNEKLEGISDKLTEIDETGKSIDDKLKDLLDWLGIGSGTGGTGGGIAPSHWYDAVLDYLDKILKQLKSIKRWTIIDTFIDGVDAIADWLDLIHDILSDVDDGMESAVSTLSSALDDATGLLKTKFPFSVPWDIFFFVTLLAAEPEVPHFEAPIDFDVSAIDMHVHYDFVVDFTDYQYLSDIFRVILSMTYAVGLLKMTAGIVSTKKEE